MIFIVDDDRSVRTSLTRLMRSADYEARAFASAEEYLRDGEWARAGAGCVILDLHMPGMSGLQVLQQLRLAKVPLPAVVITAYDEPSTRDECLAAGAAAYLRKPLDERLLLNAISATVRLIPKENNR